MIRPSIAGAGGGMRTAKVLGTLVGGVIALIVVVLAAVWLFVNPNHYKPKIVAAVKAATGRDLVLEGDIKLSLLPWIALELGPASLSSPPGFAGPPFARFQHAAVRVRLWPLLRERLEISHVDLDGLDVRLQKDATGRGNWQGFGRAAAAQPGEVASAQAPPGPTLPGEVVPVTELPALKITHARVAYENFTALDVTLETGPVVDGMVPLSIHGEVNRGVAGEQASVQAKLAFGTPAAERYRVAAVTVVGQLTLAGNNRPIRFSLDTPGIDLAPAGTLSAPTLALRVAGADMTGSLQGTELFGDPHLAGEATLAPLVLREFMPRWGLTSPHTRDPKGFAQLSGSTTFTYGAKALRFDHLRALLDSTHVAGSLGLDLATRAVTFALTADAVDVNRYLAPDNDTAGDGAQGDTARGDAAGGGAATPPSAARDVAQPFSAAGTVAIESLEVGSIDLTGVRMTVDSKDRVTRLFPLLAVVDGGRYSGDITWDASGGVPLLSLDAHLSGVDIAQLFASKPKSVHLSGKGTINLKAAAQGRSDTLWQTLNGHLDVDVTEGALEGFDLAFELGRAEALIERNSAPLENTHRTRFDVFKTSAEINGGIAETTDLTISSPALKVTGGGTANLAAQTLNLHLLADTLKSWQGVPVQIPVNVTGRLSDPTVRPDVEAFAKGPLRQRLKDLVHDKLQSLFGRP